MSDAFAAATPDGFVAGFAARHDGAATALARAFAPAGGFAAVPVGPADAPAPVSFSPQAPRGAGTGPRHFSPADPAVNPTAGWDPLDPTPVVTPAPEPASAHDRIAEARDEGYAAGLAAARAAVHEAGERDRALLAGIVDQLGRGRAIDRDALAEQLRETVMTLVSKVVGEVGVSPDLLAGRVTAAVDLLADKAESALLRVHPDDVPLLEGRLPATVFAAGDPAVPRGGFVLETASSIVEDGPALWLDQLSRAVDRVGLPA